MDANAFRCCFHPFLIKELFNEIAALFVRFRFFCFHILVFFFRPSTELFDEDYALFMPCSFLRFNQAFVFLLF